MRIKEESLDKALEAASLQTKGLQGKATTSFYTNVVLCLGKVNTGISHRLLPKLKKKKPF